MRGNIVKILCLTSVLVVEAVVFLANDCFVDQISRFKDDKQRKTEYENMHRITAFSDTNVVRADDSNCNYLIIRHSGGYFW
jgi:hypothetical protein